MNQITHTNILEALKEIDLNGVRPGRNSSTYDLVFEGKKYPPKYVISLAFRNATGEELDPKSFEGGKDTEAFRILTEKGFLIVPKKNPLLEIIAQYKSRIAQSRMQDEVYKWELISKFKGRPDTNAPDFAVEYKAVKYGNLMYQLAGGVGNHICRENSEEFRNLFVYLFDESKPLNERVNYFNEESLKLYRSIGGEKGHHQDERTISAYLTFHNPEKYTIYKSTFYKAFCKLMNDAPAGKNKKYGHYLELLNQFIEQYIVTDKELIDQVKTYIPEYYDGNNHLLLAQDILYSMLDKGSNEVNYWVFQGNPKIYDIKGALKASSVKSWSVKAHKESIKPGDKIILWSTGDEAGVYALAEVTSEPIERKEELEELKFYKVPSDNEEATRVGIVITHNLADQPITKEKIKDIKELENLKVGSQGTNFSATENEFNAILNLIQNESSKVKYWIYAPGEKAYKWDEFYSDGVMALGWDHLGDLNQYESKEEIAQALREFDNSTGSKMNNSLANYEFKNIMQIGDVILVKKGTQEFVGVGIVKSDYYFDEAAADYKSRRKVQWIKNGSWIDTNNKTVLKTLTDVTSYKDYISYLKQHLGLEQKTTTMQTSQPINQILYGPPGTGKTYTLKTEYFPLYTTKETSLSKEKHFEEVVRELTWWHVIALALLEDGTNKVNEIVANRWVSLKACLSESKNVRATIWGTLQMHTIQESTTVSYTQRQSPLIFDKKADKTWEIIESEVKESCPELYDILNSVNEFNPNPDKEIKRYVFTTFHQSFNYEDFIEGIKPVLTDDEGNGDVAYRIEDGIFKELCKRAESDPENRYAIFIDEINRGNVSNIFGELITLIEQDKRKGTEHAMSAMLPYSKKVFAVPSNVDIYGTMNTADRSVEALDTALRRRFSFTEMLPKPNLIRTAGPLKANNGILEGIDLALLLITINKRIEKLLDKDHQIGHSYFLKVDSLDSLKSSFHNAIIPLLQEYFFGDYGKIGLVLGQGFFEEMESSEDEKFFAEFKDYEIDGILDKRVYHIKDVTQLDDNSFIEIVQAILPRV
jgi:hypothetical protein